MWVLEWAITGALALLAIFSPLSMFSLGRSPTPLLDAVPYAFPTVVNDIVFEIRRAGCKAEPFFASLTLDPVFLPSPYQELLPTLRPLGLPVFLGPHSAFANLPEMEETLSSFVIASTSAASSPIDAFIELSPSSATSVEHFEPTKTLPLPYKFDDADPTIPTAHPASRLLSAAKNQFGLSYFASYSVDCPASFRVYFTSSASIPTSSAVPTARRAVYPGNAASSTLGLRFLWWTLASSLSLILVVPSAALLHDWLKETIVDGDLDLKETFRSVPTSPVEMAFILPEESLIFLELTLDVSKSSNIRIKFIHLASTAPTLVDRSLPCMTFSLRQDTSLGAISAYSLAPFAPYAMERDDIPPSLLVEDDLSSLLSSNPSAEILDPDEAVDSMYWDNSKDDFFADLPSTSSRYGLSLGSELQRAQEALSSPEPRVISEREVKNRERRRTKTLKADSLAWTEAFPDIHLDNALLSSLQ
ncbi:hypothetical protein OBBRIDRAFT_837047 [Obba rivulosa]|uniref:Uncharacterized protein n=1 Tax=Obba rivulosa TaxID=1052685 RepID=A0A8E2DME0_9APHY|nr:hypothetical protein OBBRIDRAFT_837047 [Obba rivulosa]